ncbi:hypothetical protein HN011_009545 [Eciton burchellii]|nr:hypothetical protein HN011_009545 [Eciton burchellii]
MWVGHALGPRWVARWWKVASGEMEAKKKKKKKPAEMKGRRTAYVQAARRRGRAGRHEEPPIFFPSQAARYVALYAWACDTIKHHQAGLKRLSSGRHRGISVDGRHLRHAGMLNKNVNRKKLKVSTGKKNIDTFVFLGTGI